MASRATKSDHVGMGMYEVEVRAVQQLTPHLKRVTFTGPGLHTFRDDGPDQRFKLLLPKPGQDRPVMPPADDWYGAWKRMPDEVRPVMRTYTVRRARPTEGELDVDMLTHGDTGPGSRWATAARPGDRAGLYAAWGEYEVADGAYQLIAGDHSALPAIAAICERLSPQVEARVIVEVPGPDDRLDLPTGDGVRVDWVAESGRPGTALNEAVRDAVADRTPDYAWICAEQDTVATLRRHLVRDCGLDPEQVMFMGYWRLGGAIDDD